MAGTLLTLLSMTTYDFSNLAAGGNVTQLVVPNIDVSNWPSGELLMRVHSATVTGVSIGVELRRCLPSPQDPSRVFEEAGTGPVQLGVIPNTPDAPLLLLGAISSPLGSYVNLYVRAAQHAVTPGTLQATISVELALKR